MKRNKFWDLGCSLFGSPNFLLYLLVGECVKREGIGVFFRFCSI
jgi:hypothetical protein